MLKQDALKQLQGREGPLMRVLAARRSVRKYDPGTAGPEQVAAIEAAVARFTERMRFDAARVLVVGDGDGYQDIVKAAMAGVVGKVNPWLIGTKARHIIVCGALYDVAAAARQRERAIKQAAMTMEVAIVTATELGLGTCWMAGINHERIELSYQMPDGAKIVAISPLGQRPKRMGLSWDTAAYNLVSKRRKPLHEIWMTEGWRAQS